LVTVERELKLMTPKHVLGLMAVNLKMPGFVNFSLMKPTYNAEKKQRRALNEARLRAKTVTIVNRRLSSTSNA
jgi:hypothetical protein